MQIRNDMLKVLGPEGSEADVQAVGDVLRSGWWGNGPKVAELEERFAALVGHKYALAVTSNSHGQDLVLKALGIKGVDVINPTMSFATTAIVPLWNDCTTNIVDVDPHALNITAEEVDRWKKPNTEVVIAVNMAGVNSPIPEIRKVFGGFIIEDCAHSCYTPGAGLRGDVAVWSFQSVKSIPIGDGGMITTDDRELYEKMKSMIWFGVSSTWSRVGKKGYSWDYDIDHLGYKYYMIDILAALGLSQLDRLDQTLKRRQHVRDRYNAELHPAVGRPIDSDTVQYYVARVPSNLRDALIDYLADKKIHTSVHFKPLHKFTLLQNDRSYPVADKEWLKLVSLPCNNTMTDDDIQYVVYWVNKFFEEQL